jgi:hypothetical protein
MLGRMGLLERDTAMASLLKLAGWALILVSVGLGLRFSRSGEEEDVQEL